MRILLTLLAFSLPAPVLAFDLVKTKADFLNVIHNKELQIRLYGVALKVSPQGQIAGRGGGKPVRGEWAWKGEGFCRTMVWGSEAIPYNCQAVYSDGRHIRFTSDMGQGESFTFALR